MTPARHIRTSHARADLGGEFPGETWEQAHERWAAQDQTARAIAETRAERGDWLTEAERATLAHITRWGSDGYPIVRSGRQWSYDWPSAPLYRTRREAVCAFSILYGSWSHLASLERRREGAA